jgi:predicted nucleic-acid-binding protein
MVGLPLTPPSRQRRLFENAEAALVSTCINRRKWVLRARYKKTAPELLPFFRALLETDNTVIDAAEEVSNALDWYEQGADFADALHLAACGTAVMHTFDCNFCKAAREAGTAPEVRVWAV